MISFHEVSHTFKKKKKPQNKLGSFVRFLLLSNALRKRTCSLVTGQFFSEALELELAVEVSVTAEKPSKSGQLKTFKCMG